MDQAKQLLEATLAEEKRLTRPSRNLRKTKSTSTLRLPEAAAATDSVVLDPSTKPRRTKSREASFFATRTQKKDSNPERNYRINCLLLMIILTVEDEFLISEYLRAILEGGGHTVIATFDADEAIKVLERVRDIQLVVTDIDMPGSMDGLRLAAAIRHKWPPIHLIVVTGFRPPNKDELPTDSLFIPKPYGAAEILSAVRHFQ